MTDEVTSSWCLFLVLITCDWSVSFPSRSVCLGVVVTALCAQKLGQLVKETTAASQEEVSAKGCYKGSSEQKHHTLLTVLYFFVKTNQKALSFNLGFIWVKHKMSLFLITHTCLPCLQGFCLRLEAVKHKHPLDWRLSRFFCAGKSWFCKIGFN